MLQSDGYTSLLATVTAFVAVTAVSVCFRCLQMPSTGPALPISVVLEAALTNDRLSSSRTASFIRYFLGCVHALFSVQHKILPDVAQVEKVFVRQTEVLDVHPMNRSMLRRIFGCDFDGMSLDAWVEMHDAFMKTFARDFINDAAVTATLTRGDLGAKISSLFTFSPAADQQHPWERFAGSRVVSSPDCPAPVAEVDLEHLLKALSFHISIPLMYGQDYLDRYPAALDDWTTFSTQVPLLVLGLPSWLPIPSFQRGVAARERQVDAIAAVCRHTMQRLDDEDDVKVSKAAQDRFRLYKRNRLSVRSVSRLELSLLWAQNENTQQLLFWYVYYMYSVPGLLQSLRAEIAASGVLSLSTDTDTDTDSPPRITRLDVGAVGKLCPLLKSTFLESIRLAEESVLFRRVTTETSLDTGKGGNHHLTPGSWVSVSTTLTKFDESLYPRPLEFVPDRFLEETTTSSSSSSSSSSSQSSSDHVQRTASYKTLRPWGLGPTMCKGRTFAEKKLLAVAACIVALWDMEQVGGEWTHPGFKAKATILAPAGSVRVRVKRRQVF